MKSSIAVALLLLAGACKKESVFGPPTGSVCPDVQTLSYENFGKKFMDDYCTKCHDSALRGDERQGAPSFHDFETIYGIRAVSEHIDETTAAGPAAFNEGMPESAPYPTDEERAQLGEWIACDMPTDEDLAEMAVARTAGAPGHTPVRSLRRR